jgi:hypothetical protein
MESNHLASKPALVSRFRKQKVQTKAWAHREKSVITQEQAYLSGLTKCSYAVLR